MRANSHRMSHAHKHGEKNRHKTTHHALTGKLRLLWSPESQAAGLKSCVHDAESRKRPFGSFASSLKTHRQETRRQRSRSSNGSALGLVIAMGAASHVLTDCRAAPVSSVHTQVELAHGAPKGWGGLQARLSRESVHAAAEVTDRPLALLFSGRPHGLRSAVSGQRSASRCRPVPSCSGCGS